MPSSLRKRQYVAFVLTWIAYASSYLLRKPIGVVKSDLQQAYNFTKADLGWLDSSFLFPYALMQIFLGKLGDKYAPRSVLTVNLSIAGFSMFCFGMSNKMVFLAILLFINGSAQALLWPNCIKALSMWYSDEERATLFGIWGTCVFVGGIGGTALAVHLQRLYAPDLRMIFIVPSVVVIVIAMIVYLFLKTPDELNIVIDGKGLPKHVQEEKESRDLNLFQIWKIKMVPELCWTMFGMKLVRYCLYMWLPLYLNQNLHYDKAAAAILSTSFDVGGVFGSAGIGIFISRVMHGRTDWGVFCSLVGCALSLLFFQLTSVWGHTFNICFLFLAGACCCGPDSVVSGALACEVGQRENAQSAVSGVINGFGSLGTIIEGPLIAFIATRFGWGGTFYAMIGLSLLGALAMGKAALAHPSHPVSPAGVL